MSLIVAQDVGKSFGAHDVLAGCSVRIERGDRVAVVGVNGAGKTTLLRLLARLEEPDAGTVSYAAGVRAGYLPQEPLFRGEETVRAHMLAAVPRLIAMRRELAELEQALAAAPAAPPEVLLHRYADLTHLFEEAGGYTLEQRMAQLLGGLGVPADALDRPLRTLSGGQRSRAALARLLLEEPDVLLLDEPTNHLDLNALEWLERFLQRWPGSVVVVSHDRYFLDQVANRVWELSLGRVEMYTGNYSQYLRQKAERLELLARQYSAQQEWIARTEGFIRRYRAGQRYRQARGRQKLLDRVERLERPVDERDERVMRFGLHSPVRSGRVVLACRGAVIGYPGRPLFRIPELVLERGERAALIGPNGCGKTTFLRTLLGKLPLLEGELQLGRHVHAGYYAQAHEGLSFAGAVLDELMAERDMEPGRARALLARFLFTQDDVFKPVTALSGGERSRLALAKLVIQQANVLLLDEPTNHLDVGARETLESVLQEFSGTILFVSHDRYLIDALATQVWAIEDGELRVYDGGYTEYLTATRAGRLPARPGQRRSETTPLRQVRRLAHAEPQAAAAARASEVEQEIYRLEQEKLALEEAMAEASTAGEYQRVAELARRHRALEAQLAELHVTWLAAVEGG
jgi:ATP-binding cassette subfamily F protein 3